MGDFFGPLISRYGAERMNRDSARRCQILDPLEKLFITGSAQDAFHAHGKCQGHSPQTEGTADAIDEDCTGRVCVSFQQSFVSIFRGIAGVQQFHG